MQGFDPPSLHQFYFRQEAPSPMTTEFTPLMSLFGGMLIGLSAVILMLFNGRIAGMTGILGGVLPPVAADWTWRAVFLLGAILPAAILSLLGHRIEFGVPVSTAAIIVGGLVVGAGVVYGGGCPSGHGVCGIARLSPRSIVATLVFMAAAFVTVFVVRHMLGGLA
jgi:uncharacterized protein